jgi:hypothetical protein
MKLAKPWSKWSHHRGGRQAESERFDAADDVEAVFVTDAVVEQWVSVLS